MAVAAWYGGRMTRPQRIGVFALALAFAAWSIGRIGTTAYAWALEALPPPNDIVWVALIFQTLMSVAYIYFAVALYRWGIAR
jgi:hypothetical protein